MECKQHICSTRIRLDGLKWVGKLRYGWGALGEEVTLSNQSMMRFSPFVYKELQDNLMWVGEFVLV